MPEISPFVSSPMAILAGYLEGRLKRIKTGNLTANGTEQTVLEYLELGRVVGYIDLSKMMATDIVVVREYVKVKENGVYVPYTEEEYGGVQSPPLLYVHPRESGFAIKITLQQTLGSYKTFNYDFLREL